MKFLQKALEGKDPGKNKLFEKPQKPVAIIEALIQALAKEYPERSHKVVHASDLTKEDFCPRAFCLMDALKVEPKPRYIDTALKTTFDVGHAIGAMVCEKWLRDRAVGHWQCSRCGTIQSFCKYPGKVMCYVPGFAASPSGLEMETVVNTGKPCDWQYKEVTFTDYKYMYNGSVDLFLDLGQPKLRAVELKIMAPDQFAELKGPLAEHRVRTALYLNLIEMAAYDQQVDVSQASILYVSRGYGKKHPEYGKILPFKEFAVARDDMAIVPYLERAHKIAQYRLKGIMPDRVCPVSFCNQANACQVQKPCWSGDFPPTPVND